MPWAAAAVAGGIAGVGSVIGGSSAAKGAKKAAKIQAASAREARAMQERLNKPYIDLGTENLPAYQGILNDPRYNTFETLQADPYGVDYLSNNPLFQASIDNAGRQMGANAAAQGKSNSGGLVTGEGNALAAGQIGQANAYGQTAQNLANIGGQVLGYGANSGWFQGAQQQQAPTSFNGGAAGSQFGGGLIVDYGP